MKIQAIQIDGERYDIGSSSFTEGINRIAGSTSDSSIENSIVEIGKNILSAINSVRILTSEEAVNLVCLESKTNVEIIVDSHNGRINPQNIVPPIEDIQSIFSVLKDLDYSELTLELCEYILYAYEESNYNSIIARYLNKKGFQVYIGKPVGGGGYIKLIRFGDRFVLHEYGEIKLQKVRTPGLMESTNEFYLGLNYNGENIIIELQNSAIIYYTLAPPTEVNNKIYCFITDQNGKLHLLDMSLNIFHHIGAHGVDAINDSSIRFYLDFERRVFIDFLNGKFSKELQYQPENPDDLSEIRTPTQAVSIKTN